MRKAKKLTIETLTKGLKDGSLRVPVRGTPALSPAQVKALRRVRAMGASFKQLGEAFDVSLFTAFNACKGRGGYGKPPYRRATK